MGSRKVDRRTFLATSALAADGILSAHALQSPVVRESGDGKTGLDRSRVSVITDEVALSEAEGFAFVRKYSLRWIELRTVPGGGKLYTELLPSTLRQFRRQMEDAGIGVSFLNTWILKWTLPGTEPRMRDRYSMEEWTKRTRADADRMRNRMEHLKRAIETAQILGVETIRIFTFWRTETPLPLYPRIAEIIGPMAELAGREGVRLLVENESACNVATSQEIRQMLELLPQPAIGLNWDPHNSLIFEPEPFPSGYRLLPKERIGNVQIKGESLLTPGETLDWRGIVEAMLADGYTGHFGLETHFGEGQQRIQNAHDSIESILKLVDG